MSEQEQDKIIDKLKKLRRHQKSAAEIGNEDEAQAFALKFQELMAKHKIDMSDVEWEEHKKEVPIVQVYVSHAQAGLKTSKIRVAWMLDLARQIGVAQNCATCLITANRDFFYVGEQLDAEAARDVYYYMVHVAEQLADKEYVKFFYKCRDEGDVTRARGFRQGFLFGFVTRLKQRYEEERKKLEQGNPGTALMRLNGALQRAKKHLEDDPDTTMASAPRMKTPENIEGVMAGRKKADEVKFNAGRLA